MFDEDESTLICPYCGEVQQCHEPDDFTSYSCYTQCERCEKNFWYAVKVTREYDSYKDDKDSEDKEDGENDGG